MRNWIYTDNNIFVGNLVYQLQASTVHQQKIWFIKQKLDFHSINYNINENPLYQVEFHLLIAKNQNEFD